MEKDKNIPSETPDLEELLTTPEVGSEITTDESAVAPHGMGQLSDIELEKIIQQAIDENWGGENVDDGSYESDPEFPSQEYAVADQPEGFDAYSDAAEPEETPEEGGVPRKVRPKRKGGYGLFGLPHILSSAIWLLIAFAIGISLGRLVWVCAADILAFGREDRPVSITITASDTIDSITDKLYNAGLIQYKGLFKMYAELTGVEEKEKISVGTFELNTLYDYHALVGGMSATSSYRQTIKVMIPEGYTCAQIFKLLEEKGVCSAEAMEAYAEESDFSSYWFLENVEKGTKYCLEGFLFPDTYEFYTNDTPKRVFSKLLARFDDQFDDELQAMLVDLNKTVSQLYRYNGLSQAYIDSHQLTIHDVVIIASMIEKESAHTGEIRDISSVIYNRLTNPSEFPKLEIDATIVYALGGKNDLIPEDYTVDSPYNTYLYEGLPPGAISNPGLFSLKAALSPADTNYYFYALDPTAEVRGHKFFRTYREHLEFLESLR